MDLLYAHVEFWWAAGLGLLLISMEAFIPATLFLWTGLSCLAVSLVLALVPGFPLIAAIGLWILLSFATVLLARRYHRKHPDAGEQWQAGQNPNRYGTEFIGMTTTLKSDSEEGHVRVTLKGGNWGVKLPGGDLKAGAKIRIRAVDGIFLVAEAAEDGPGS